MCVTMRETPGAILGYMTNVVSYQQRGRERQRDVLAEIRFQGIL